jgi:putative transport protein
MTESSTALEFLRGQPVITLFLALALGYALGRIRIAGFSFGAVAGTLFVSPGAMTSSAALGLLTSEARSAVPALGYTGTYAFANVILTILGTLVMLL